jgi:hypothetical protein
MRYLLDTNVISEGVSRRPDPGVIAWGNQQSPLDLFVSALSLGEIRKGVELRFPDSRRAAIENWLSSLLPAQFRGRILPVDEEVALQWGRIAAEGQKNGRVLPAIDGLLIATAIVHEMTLVTRNERDCSGRGVPVLNPWSS